MKSIIAILLLTLVVGCGNIKLVPRKRPQTTEATKVDNPDRLICTNEKVIGSNITQKVCRTAKQKKEEEENSKKAIRDEIQRINRKPMGTGN